MTQRVASVQSRSYLRGYGQVNIKSNVKMPVYEDSVDNGVECCSSKRNQSASIAERVRNKRLRDKLKCK